MEIGSIKIWGSDELPQGWLLCNGSEVSRESFKELFQIIGTTFGEGNGITTFNLPDLRGKVVVGKSNETEFNIIGKTGGEKEHTLSVEEMPEHYHDARYSYPEGSGITISNTGEGERVLDIGGWSWGSNVLNTKGTGSNVFTNKEGGSQPHNNLQPYQTLNYIIKASISGAKKISELDELDTLETSDVLAVVDNSDSETKKVSIETLLNTIIESGSANNQSWVKYADGTMVIKGKTETFAVPRENGVNIPIHLEQEFIEGDVFCFGNINRGLSYWDRVRYRFEVAGGYTINDVTLVTWNSSQDDCVGLNFFWEISGRWK